MMVDNEQARQIIEKGLQDIGLSDEQISLYFEDSEEGRAYRAQLSRNYVLDIDSILYERNRTRKKTIYDYRNEMAIAKDQGREEGIEIGRAEGIKISREEGIKIGRAAERNQLIENMRKAGFTEEQIRIVSGTAYDS